MLDAFPTTRMVQPVGGIGRLIVAIFFVLFGLALLAIGTSAWFGWYRSWARAPLGNMVVPLVPIGAGWLIVGVTGMTGFGLLILPGVLLMLGGVLVYVFFADWLDPPWYREYKQLRERRRPSGRSK